MLCFYSPLQAPGVAKCVGGPVYLVVEPGNSTTLQASGVMANLVMWPVYFLEGGRNLAETSSDYKIFTPPWQHGR